MTLKYYGCCWAQYGFLAVCKMPCTLSAAYRFAYKWLQVYAMKIVGRDENVCCKKNQRIPSFWALVGLD